MLLSDITPLIHVLGESSSITSLPPDDSITQPRTLQQDCSPDESYEYHAEPVPLSCSSPAARERGYEDHHMSERPAREEEVP